MGGAFGDYGIGAVGGAIFALASQFLGSGLLGTLAAPLLAGSILKGTRGTVISTLAGYELGKGLLSGQLFGMFGQATSGDSRGTM